MNKNNKNNENIQVLCFLDYDEGRDVEILLPVIYYIETYHNANVNFAFIRDIHKIYKQKPDLVLIANAIGSNLHFIISKYACENNIPVFALISEGNFRTDGTFNYWGYNTDKKIYQEKLCLWSERTYKFLSKELPEESNKMAITGAVGFDRYKIYKFISKDDYLEKNGYGNYKKVIVYAGWAFGKIFNKSGIIEIMNAHKDNSEERVKWMKEQMILVEDILRQAIENNPDILFILKRHPNEIHPHLKQADKNEMVNLKDYPNVIYTIDANIHDLISIADIFTGFETTTALETWILNEKKPTLLINPDENFKRDKLFKGSVIAHSYDEFQSYINEFYKSGEIKEFNVHEKKNPRNILLKDTVGFSDGMNHIRTGYYIGKTLKKIKPNKDKNVNFKINNWLWFYLVHIGKFFYWRSLFIRLPKFKKTVWIFDNLNLRKIPALKKKYYTFLDDFHKKHDISENINNPDFFQKILDIREE